jgi:hypothetical protein
VTEFNVWKAAELLTSQHGENAELEAAKLAKLMLDRGDNEGSQEWEWVRRLIAGGRMIAAQQAQASDLSPTRPVSPAEAEVVTVAERTKQDLSMAIAAERVMRPAACDEQLINCFNIGFGGRAFDLIRHSLLFFQTMALMRLWDARQKKTCIRS